MSDYLSNLIDRSFNPGESIRPLLPSRFEPLQQQSAELITEQLLEFEQENRFLQPSPVENLSSPPQYLRSSSLFQPSREDLDPFSAAQPTATESVFPRSIEQEPNSTQVVQQYFVEQVTGSLTANNLQPESPLLPQETAPRQTPPLIRPQIMSLPQSVISSAPTTEVNPPTINITIGRVDVRAITSTSSPRQAPKSPTPNLSLAEYLKSGGRS
jgi:hypothetical protein